MEKEWIKIAGSVEAIPFGTNGIAEFEAGGRHICVAKYKGQLYAFAPKCPHASGRFIDGFIDALGNVVCPLHRYKFCLKNGRNVSGEGYYLKHWVVKVEDGIFINFEPL
jgi:3-phenylpropionate/trans-cinnamate dioxygenase ferredoxin subunit